MLRVMYCRQRTRYAADLHAPEPKGRTAAEHEGRQRLCPECRSHRLLFGLHSCLLTLHNTNAT